MEFKLQLKREHFIRVNQDAYHYHYSFGVPGFEICLEPCAGGFDVAIYANSYPTEFPELKGEKICTKTGDYLQSVEGLFGDRSDEDWNKALLLADELLEKHIKNPEKLREILALIPETKGDLITAEEIKALRANPKTFTIVDALAITMSGKFVAVIPTPLKSGYCASFSKCAMNKGRIMELLSVGSHGEPDAADAECIATAFFDKGYTSLSKLQSKGMLHFCKLEINI